jgi:hypothetical protein
LDGDGEDSPVGELVAAALVGDVRCWNDLVQRYTPLLLSVVRRFRLDGSDAEDVVQTVWLRLVEQLGRIREAQALPGWIVTTARHECLHVLDGRRRVAPTDLADQGWPPSGTRRCSRLWRSSPSGSGRCCCSCCTTRRSPTRRSVDGSASRWGASDPRAPVRWSASGPTR